jgi:hypothetical protein
VQDYHWVTVTKLNHSFVENSLGGQKSAIMKNFQAENTISGHASEAALNAQKF